MKKLIFGVLAVFMGLVVVSVPVAEDVFAANSCVATAVWGNAKCKEVNGKLVTGHGGSINCSCDKGDGSEVKRILQIVVDVLTIGVGILGVVGITISGVQYLTAGGSEEKTRKAKRRLFEIVIGLVAYVLIYAGLSFLIPGFEPFNW